VQTDRRDAGPRARPRRSGELTPVAVPTVEDEARRELSRARAEALRDLTAAKFRLTAFLRRPASRWTGRATWSPAPRSWLSGVVCATPAPQLVFQDDVRAVNEQPQRLQRLEQARQDHVDTWRLPPVVEALQAWRGVQFTVAVTLVAELGARPRFEHPRQRVK
jgi:transposase